MTGVKGAAPILSYRKALEVLVEVGVVGAGVWPERESVNKKLRSSAGWSTRIGSDDLNRPIECVLRSIVTIVFGEELTNSEDKKKLLDFAAFLALDRGDGTMARSWLLMPDRRIELLELVRAYRVSKL